MPGKNCRNLCLEFRKVSFPFGIKFLTHKKCRVCDVYFPLNTIQGIGSRCFCCSNILATKPKIAQGKRNQEAYEVPRI